MFVWFTLGLLVCLTPRTLTSTEIRDYRRPFPLAGRGLGYETPVPSQRSQHLRGLSSPLDWPNIKINQDTTIEVQNEEQVVVNPTNRDNLVAVWRDFRLGYRQVGFGYSFDGGQTWDESLFSGTPYMLDSDPGLTVDTDGNFYAVILSFIATWQPNGLFVFKSSDGGMSWSGPSTVVDSMPGVFEDKELIACDRSGGPYNGNLYVAWTRFGAATNILVSRSTDGGSTFRPPAWVSDVESVQWPVPAVGEDGNVYVAWFSFYGQILLDVSTDGGASFGTDRVICAVSAFPGEINGGVLVYPFPAIDADITGGTHDGNLYVAYMDDAGADMDIFFRRSTDGGQAWSAALRVNDDPMGNGCDQFHPWICIDEDGVITAVWLDRRLDPANLLYDLYLAQSLDGGNSFTENIRVSTVSSDPTAGSKAGLLGEYIGVTSSQGRVNPVWTDTREGNQDVYTAVLDSIPIGVEETANDQLTTTKSQMIQSRPNPFSHSTVIHYSLPPGHGDEGTPRRGEKSHIADRTSHITLSIYDLSGRLIRILVDEPSSHPTIQPSNEVAWDGTDDGGRRLPGGVYFCRLETAGTSVCEKVVLLR